MFDFSGDFHTLAYLGPNEKNGEMMFTLDSKSKPDKRRATMMINDNGGGFDGRNKMGEVVVLSAIGVDGGGFVGTYDKFGYAKEGLGVK